MSIEVLVPNLPESVADATLIAWHKSPGDSVSKNDNLVDLETDKVVLEVTAPESGVLADIIKANGSVVTSGELLALIDKDGSAQKAAPVAADKEADKKEADKTGQHTAAPNDTAPSAAGEMPLSPSVRRLLHEHPIDPAAIAGTGKSGRLTKGDVLEHLRKQTTDRPEPKQEISKPEIEQTQVHTPARTVDSAPNVRPEQRVPMTRLRAKIAERLLQAQQNAAMLTTFNEVNMKSVMDLRAGTKSRFEERHSVKLGFMSFFVKASIEALKRFPAVNASIDGTDIIYHGYYDMGIAVSTPRGLIVPVIRDADQLDFAGIEKSIVDFGEKARAGTLTYEDLKGGTFTITNGGVFGSMLSTPILNPPQCAILGMHAIKERPVVENGQVVIRPMMYLALSYDHRLVDGREAVQFLVTVKDCLEAPAHLLLNI
jgi:2-oxoglutarate dehydrogenase E2 component (dihydrolipoamide succinyltransferase)